MKGIRFLLICTVFSINVSAQDDAGEEYRRPAQLKSLARHAERKNDPYTAIYYYEKYLFRVTDDYKALFRLAEQYRQSRDYIRAEDAYRRCFEASHGNNKLAEFHYARMVKINGNCRKAAQLFNEVLSTGIRFKDDLKYKKLAKAEIEGCRIRETSMYADSLQVVHLDSTVNRAYSEAAPAMLEDSIMIYSSLRADTTVYMDEEEEDSRKLPTKRFYMAVKENGKWKGDELWQVPFNRKGMSVSNGCFSPDGKRFYFTIGRKDWKNRIVNAVYVSENRSGRWQQPSLIKEIRSRRHSCTHPAVASGPKPGQEILYFVSDRPGGRGGTDIWYTIHNIKRKTFTKPRNVGPQINTVGEEFTPFWDDSLKVLYFSSTGWPGYGGFDIFRAKGGTAGWTLPENMGPPVNSAVDDIYYTVKPASKEGLLVSNREGTVPLRHPTCCDDIFSFGPAADSLYPVKGAVAQVKDTSSIEAGLISQDMEPVSGAVVKLFRRDVKLNQEYLVMKDTTDNLGRYKLNIRKGNDYKLSIDKEGYFSFSTAFNSTDVLEGRDSSLRTISLRKATSQPIVVKNINYAFARYELTDSIKWILDRTLLKVLQDNPFLVIEIASHTDNIGGEKFNLELSEKRAGKVAEYLISKGISPDRLQTKGYGEHKPVAANSSGDGKDDPGGRAANRRTEFRITGWVKN